MKINFSYSKKKIEFNSGHIFKGFHYRCSYVRYLTAYRNPAPGTETVQIYNFQPKEEVRATVLILHGLGSSNVKFLLWMGMHLASAGVNAAVLILPGNYTRVESGSASGRSYLYPDLNVMYRFWEHGVVDSLGAIDFLEQENLWKENNCVVGYCLGGMISSMVGVFEKRITQVIMMTTGGHFPKILFESPIASFVRKMFIKGFKSEFHLHNREKMYKIYEEQIPLVKKMTFREFLENEEIHPIMKIDPLLYSNFLDKSRTTLIDAFFDKALPRDSRGLLYKEMKGAKRYILPSGHGSWLPFEYLLAKYILHKVNLNDKNSKRMLLKKEEIEDPLIDLKSK